MEGYLRIAYVKYNQKTCSHDYLQISVIKYTLERRFRNYKEIYYSQRYNLAIHSKKYILETIHMLKKHYEVDKVVLSSTKKYPNQVQNYFKDICL